MNRLMHCAALAGLILGSNAFADDTMKHAAMTKHQAMKDCMERQKNAGVNMAKSEMTRRYAATAAGGRPALLGTVAGREPLRQAMRERKRLAPEARAVARLLLHRFGGRGRRAGGAAPRALHPLPLPANVAHAGYSDRLLGLLRYLGCLGIGLCRLVIRVGLILANFLVVPFHGIAFLDGYLVIAIGSRHGDVVGIAGHVLLLIPARIGNLLSRRLIRRGNILGRGIRRFCVVARAQDQQCRHTRKKMKLNSHYVPALVCTQVVDVHR